MKNKSPKLPKHSSPMAGLDKREHGSVGMAEFMEGLKLIGYRLAVEIKN